MKLKFFKSKKQFWLFVFAAMAAFLIFNGTFYELVRNTLTIKKLKKEAALLDASYEALNREYQKITAGDKSYVEEAARVKYHMSRPGEIEYRINK